jgi:hypothetical protein
MILNNLEPSDLNFYLSIENCGCAHGESAKKGYRKRKEEK